MKTLALEQIDTHPAALARVRPCEDTLTRYMDLIQAGTSLPPVTVFHDGKQYWLADGRHRLEATRRLGYPDIQADIRSGSERDAMLYAFTANLSHGLPASHADRKKIAQTLLEDADWRSWSDRKIAEISGLTHPTVGKIREALVKFTTLGSSETEVSEQPSAQPTIPASVNPPKVTSESAEPQYDPVEDQLQGLSDLVAELATENETLKEQIALGNMQIPENEKLDIATQLKELRTALNLAKQEVESLRTSRDMFMMRSHEMHQQLKKMQHVLKKKDQTIASLQAVLAETEEALEQIKVELAFEIDTRR